MPDIAMCVGTDKQICKRCYRNDKNTIAGLCQTYFEEPPIEGEECTYLMNT